jgi:hypothetical protein
MYNLYFVWNNVTSNIWAALPVEIAVLLCTVLPQRTCGEPLDYRNKYTVKPGYNDIGLSDTSYIRSHVLW